MTKGHGIGVRHLQSLLMFTMLTVAVTFRTAMNIAVEAILDNSKNKNFPQYPWSAPIPDMVKSSFFVGYVIMQYHASRILVKYGNKNPLALSMLLCSLLSFLQPTAAAMDWKVVAFIRMLQGFCQAFCYPSCHQMLSKWIPVSELSAHSTYIYGGGSMGVVVALPISGWLAASESFGWPSIFYVNGVVGIVWVIVWWWLGSNAPDECKIISKEEQKYIEQSLHALKKDNQKKLPVPWKSLLTSMPFWAIVIAHSGNNWGYWTLLTDMPTYMKNILNMDIASNGINSALPYLAMWGFGLIYCPMCDYLINHKICSTITVRKLSQILGHYVAGAALIALGYVDKDQTALAMTLLIIAVSLNVCVFSGYLVNHVDLAPNFAASLMALTNGTANFVSLFAPTVCGLIANDERKTDPLAWRAVFYLSAGFFIVGTTFYLIFGSADRQAWNEPIDSDSDEPQAKAQKKSIC